MIENKSNKKHPAWSFIFCFVIANANLFVDVLSVVFDDQTLAFQNIVLVKVSG